MPVLVLCVATGTSGTALHSVQVFFTAFIFMLMIMMQILILYRYSTRRYSSTVRSTREGPHDQGRTENLALKTTNYKRPQRQAPGFPPPAVGPCHTYTNRVHTD
jgi:hypothetical protein